MSAKATNAVAQPRSAELGAPSVEPEILIDLVTENAQLRAALALAEGIGERRELVTLEIKHRMGNLLSVVQAIARRTFRGADARLAEQFNARLGALANAQKLLIDSETRPADLMDVVHAALAAHLTANSRWNVAGPPVSLTGRRAHALTLALHELATNAAKYGALSVDKGLVEVTWSSADGQLDFRWLEVGGPCVSPPRRRGFGSSLITVNLGSAFCGKVQLGFDWTGVDCRLVAPL